MRALRLLVLVLALALAPLHAHADRGNYLRWVRHDYYGALNVTRAANATEIAKKYRRLALQYHPDKLRHLPKHEHRKAQATFEAIAEAKEVLSDAETRAAYDETIDGLPRFARPRYGSKSVFDKERLKIGPVAVLAGCFLATVTFITLNQRANQVSDKASITRSEYYQRWLKRARKVAKEDRYKDRAPGSSAAENDDAYFERFLEEERIVFRDGWEYTLLGRWARKLRGKGDPPKTRAEVAAAVALLRAEAATAEAGEKKAPPSPAKRRDGARDARRGTRVDMNKGGKKKHR